MLIKNKFVNILSIIISLIIVGFIGYMIYKSYFIVKKQFIDVGDYTYVNQVRVDDYTKRLSSFLVKDCRGNEFCEVQKMLDFTTNIPYKINESVARSAKQVVKQNFGDCDDKSNLLISMLKVRDNEAYFVLVPKHIFVIVKLKTNLNKKALYINGERFYILETTAKNSKVGFPLKNKISEIEGIINPFENKQLDVKSLEYR